MSRKRYTPEQIIGKLREAEVALGKVATEGLAVLVVQGDVGLDHGLAVL
jgi:hypothetical protein